MRWLAALALAAVCGGVGFVAGRASVAPPAGVVVRGAPVVLGAVGRAELDAAVGARLDGVRQAYASALDDEPTLAGEVVVKVTLDEKGGVTRTQLKSSSLPCEPCEAAAIAAFEGLKGARPSRGTAIVVYPLHFFPG